MSNLVFPTFAGTGIAIKRTPVFSTVVQVAASGKELRSSYQSTPRFRYEIPLNFVRQYGFSANTTSDEAAALLSFFNSMKGMWDSFWLPDPMAVNLVQNGTCEDANPTAIGAAGVTVDAASYLGTKDVSIYGPTADTVIPKSANLPCVPGDQFYFCSQGRNYCSAGGTGQGFLVARWLDSTGTVLAGAAGYTAAYTWATPVNSLAWVFGGGVVTAPVGAAYVRFDVEALSLGSTGGASVSFDNIFACRLAAAGLIAAPDGALTRIADTNDFQRQVRFDMDEQELTRMFNLCWDGGAIKFISVK